MKNKEIIALIDYKNHFGFSAGSKFYRSGMDIELLKKFSMEKGYSFKMMHFNDLDFRNLKTEDTLYIYTSQEDPGYHYKGYIEDIVYSLELGGAYVLPKYKYLRANNNKVFMELLRDLSKDEDFHKIKSNGFGTFEELEMSNVVANEKKVIKKAAGATSKGVFLSSNQSELLKTAKKVSSSPWTWDGIKDLVRPYLHKGYIPNSRNRKKFIIQNFIPDLKNDWKILVFGDKYFIEYRGVRENDFRASGSHKFLFNDDIADRIPAGIFHFAEKIKNILQNPHFSIDIGFVNNVFYVFEFQALSFSSYAQLKSTCYYERKGEEFIRVNENFPLEYLYIDSLIQYYEKRLD